uniref:Uncharacterized protein n=1 Tax=Arion vulgaris TaxID=1028688 RepID=A0A0B7BML7_9EUPU
MKNTYNISGYMDESAENAVKNRGAGVYIEYPNKIRNMISVATVTFCDNYEAEIQVSAS